MKRRKEDTKMKYKFKEMSFNSLNTFLNALELMNNVLKELKRTKNKDTLNQYCKDGLKEVKKILNYCENLPKSKILKDDELKEITPLIDKTKKKALFIQSKLIKYA